jgi:hypothetical protein
VAYLKANGKPPIEYVVDKFKQHNIVILGEGHRIRETCEFISDLIEPLYYQAGIRHIAMEFLKYKNTSLANQLVTGETYDEELALDLFRNYGEIWGYQEYMDILRAVWQVNHTLPPKAEKFIVIGLDSDWDINVLRTGQSLWKLPGTFCRMAKRDKFMAKVLDWKVLKKGQKALVHIGGHHDFTRYRQPLTKNGKLIAEASPRFGCILYEKYKDKIFQIMLHRRHSRSDEGKSQPPLVVFLEDVLAINGNMPVGFDIESTPFTPLRDSKNYLFAYQNYVVFSDIAQGYIFLKPLKKLNSVSWADGFINEENFEQLEDFLCRRGHIQKNEHQTPEELNMRMKLWHDEKMKQQWGK